MKRFVLEYVVAVSTATGREIVANDNNFAVKVFNGSEAEYIGVVSNKIKGTDISFSGAEIFDEILMPQGAVTTKTYGAYDRALRWAESSFEFDVEDVDKLRVALALLKLSSDHTKPFCEREALFAQKLREVPLKELKGPKRGSKLDYDMFSEIRTIWLSQGLYSAEECLQKMMDKLVPDVYDSQNFKRIFGMLPQPGNELLTRKQLSRIDRGMEMFTKEFASLKEY